jgi:uridylate kinase
MEIGAQVILKATKVDGIYDDDPKTNNLAKKFQNLTYLDVLNKGLKIMDSTAISLCMDNKLPLVIFNFREKHSIKRILLGEKLGTKVGV